MTEYSCVDCFSGAGGLALGLSNAGIKPLLSFDIDRHCIDSFGMNTKYFNHVALCEGIDSMLDGRLLNMVGKKKGELFLLAGGPPCQGFSVQRIGKDDDPRNLLVLQYAQLMVFRRGARGLLWSEKGWAASPAATNFLSPLRFDTPFGTPLVRFLNPRKTDRHTRTILFIGETGYPN